MTEYSYGQMSEIDWQAVPNFNSTSDRSKIGATDMCKELMFKLQGMRQYAGKSFIVHNGYALTGHSTKSQHALKRAIDGHFTGMSLLEQYLLAERFGFRGIGVYPYWNSPGLHIDTRPIPLGNRQNRWWRDADGQYHGISYNDVVSWATIK